MIEWKTAVVTEVVNTGLKNNYRELKVKFNDGTEGIAVYDFDDHGQSIKVADQVLLNTTAVTLGLGTGGVHFVHTILNEGTSSAERDVFPASKETPMNGHIIKLRYTSLQRSVLAVEEQSSPYHELFTQKLTLEGMPVLVGELHSMLPALLCTLQQRVKEEKKAIRIAYIMTDSAALPLAFSMHVKELKQLEWVVGCITYGQAYGGDIEAVNKHTALLAAKHVLHADLAIVLPGPGSVGTGTSLGFSGTEVAELLNAVGALQGMPIALPRISFADARERHRGISHHTLTVLSDLTQIRAFVPLPILDGEQSERIRNQVLESQIAYKHSLIWQVPLTKKQWQCAVESYRLPIASMGRGLLEDPAFWSAVGVSANFAWHYSTRP
ncbi:DUF3866 family protein [Paenibacillus sp. RC67]|uniref:DUF3866 family protein n=1 Tax=Paenibacillus sp. RC67 TaxID=3039392 RepID=UPI0024ADFD84|nr:DUF3866 family protein [Paenibacillus sp. RC67]